MKKIKVNENIFKKGKLVLISSSLIATLALSGCSFGANGERAKYSNTGNVSIFTDDTIDNNNNDSNNNNNDINDNTNDYSELGYEQTKKLNIPLKNIGNTDLRNLKLNYNNTNNINFKNYLNNADVVYDYADLYNFEEALNEYSKLKLTETHQLKLKNLTYEELEKIILENNKLFKEKNNSSIYKDLSKTERKKIIDTIITTVNDFIKSNDDISVDRIKCVLGDLKLFVQKSSLNNAFVTNDNCLVISPNMIKFANVINGEGTYEDILKHEIIHLLQKGCNCDLKNNNNLKRNFGISYSFKNVGINSLEFSWLYEASAEKNMVNYTGHDALVYKNMIGYLESLSIANLIKDDYKLYDTEELSFKRNLTDLYDYFGVTTEKEKIEILNMMYSLEVMQQAPDEFYKLLEAKTGIKKDNNLVDKVNYTVKSSICETLSKQFYKNLSNSIVDKDISLGDVFYLISIFENDINNHILYNSQQKYSYNEKFINKYLNIQDNFFLEISKNLNISQEELENLYNNYNSEINIGDNIVKNYNLEFLSKEKINYIEERRENLKNITAPTIRLTNDEIFNNKTKKVYN